MEGFAEWATVARGDRSLWNLREVKIGKQKFPIKRELNGTPTNLFGFFFDTFFFLGEGENISRKSDYTSWYEYNRIGKFILDTINLFNIETTPSVPLHENVGGIFIIK